MKFEQLLIINKLPAKVLRVLSKFFKKKDKNQLKKKKFFLSKKNKTRIIKKFQNNDFTEKQKKLVFMQFLRERVYLYEDIRDIDTQFEFIINDLETRMESDEYMEEIELKNKKLIMLEIKDPVTEELNIFYEKVFYVLTAIGLILFILLKILNFCYKIYSLLFPFDPTPVFFNYWIINDVTFSWFDKIILTMYNPTSYIVEKLIDYCIQNDIFF